VLHDLAYARPDGMIADPPVAIACQPPQVGAHHVGKPTESPIGPADRVTERGAGREVDPIVGVDQLVRLDVHNDAGAIRGAQKVVRHVRTERTACHGELEPKGLSCDADNVWVEVEGDQVVTLTTGFKRHVTLCRRQPQIANKIALPASRTQPAKRCNRLEFN